jgi:hypothetical protein
MSKPTFHDAISVAFEKSVFDPLHDEDTYETIKDRINTLCHFGQFPERVDSIYLVEENEDEGNQFRIYYTVFAEGSKSMTIRVKSVLYVIIEDE